MVHMPISGTEPSSVILSQTKLFQKLKSSVPKQVEAKGDGVINQQIYNCNQFYKETFDALKKLRINQSWPWNLATCALVDSLVHQQ